MRFWWCDLILLKESLKLSLGHLQPTLISLLQWHWKENADMDWVIVSLLIYNLECGRLLGKEGREMNKQMLTKNVRNECPKKILSITKLFIKKF